MRVNILGNGAWGTAIAMVACGNGHEVTIWGHNQHYVDEVQQTRRNAKYLPGIRLPDAINFTADPAAAATGDLLFEAVPTPHLREVLARFGFDATVIDALCEAPR